jgi:hypothetical protein
VDGTIDELMAFRRGRILAGESIGDRIAEQRR